MERGVGQPSIIKSLQLLQLDAQETEPASRSCSECVCVRVCVCLCLCVSACAPYSDEGEDVVHVGPDVDLHEAYDHPHLLEEELERERGREGR